MKLSNIALLIFIGFVLYSCKPKDKTKKEPSPNSSEEIIWIYFDDKSPAEFKLEVPQNGRYRVEIYGDADSSASVWIEDYIENKDDRTYNITGSLVLNEQGMGYIEGSPLAQGEHLMRLHQKGVISVDSLKFEMIQKHKASPVVLEQKTDGEEWKLVWSDEFEGKGLPDDSKWSYNIGNWGWGNNELQYYTAGKTENVRQENGNLIIEARKNDRGYPWTSARLTTQGKTAFLYGKIEFRAKVPVGRGTWAAGWLLGNKYVDEISWPYCGEIDVLECVGYEIDNKTGTGKNHATCHTRAYYFKQGNQIGNEISVDSMNTAFHTYSIEWYPDHIDAFLDGEKYFTYDKNANELEWPFYKSQNIVINLAIGGGWGGAQGIDPTYEKHQYILDYIRVYEKI